MWAEAPAKTRISLAEAEPLALAALELLAPACTRIMIAGSIRRRKPDVGDIELVCVPRFTSHAHGLFADVMETTNELDTLCLALRQSGELLDRPDKNGLPAWGSKFKRARFRRGFALDLFIVIEPAQWGVIATIRTGPADYSRRLVTGQRYGGSMPNGLHIRDGGLRRRDTGALIPTPEEADFYRECAIPWRAPEDRV